MYKLMFFALIASAVYPEWPVDAVTKSQQMMADFQSRTSLLGLNELD